MSKPTSAHISGKGSERESGNSIAVVHSNALGKTSTRGHSKESPIPESLTILVVDDHALVREGLKLLLKEVEFCSEALFAASGAEAIELIEEKDVDLVLLDVFLGNESGLDTLVKIKELDADIPVIMLSVSESAGVIRDAITAGASGYIVKSAPREVLIHSMNMAISGQKVALLPLSFVSGPAPGEDGHHSGSTGGSDDVRTRHSKLTKREATILNFIKEGMSNKEIARALGIFEGTVKVHVKSIFRKLGAKNRTVAALMAAGVDQNGEHDDSNNGH